MREVHTTFGRVLYAVVGLLTAALGITGLVLDHGRSSGWVVVLMVLWSVLGVLLLVRSTRTGLAFDEHVIEVRGVLRTRSFDRSRARLLMDAEPVGLSVPRVRVAGRIYPVYGMTGWPRVKNKDAVVTLLQTNGLMKQPH